MDLEVIRDMEELFDKRVLRLLLLLRQEENVPLHVVKRILDEDMIRKLLNRRIIRLHKIDESTLICVAYPKGELISKAIYEIYIALKEGL